jgi:hypothetical protein
MKKVLAGVAGLLVVMIVLLEGLWLESHTKPSEIPTLSVATSTIATSTNLYSIHIEYPVFHIAAADQHIKSILDSALLEFTTLPPNPTPIAAESELDGQYSNTYVGSDVLSAKFELYEFTGGAHGNTTVYGFNFHPDGSIVSLDEALARIGKTLQQVSDEAHKQLTERFGMVQFPEGIEAKPENYSTFVIGKDTVTFMFQPYQVEAYAAGKPEIVFTRIK